MTHAQSHNQATQMSNLMSNVLGVALLILGALPMIALSTLSTPLF